MPDEGVIVPKGSLDCSYGNPHELVKLTLRARSDLGPRQGRNQCYAIRYPNDVLSTPISASHVFHPSGYWWREDSPEEPWARSQERMPCLSGTLLGSVINSPQLGPCWPWRGWGTCQSTAVVVPVVLGCRDRAVSMHMHQWEVKGRASLEQRCWEPQSHPQHRAQICRALCSLCRVCSYHLHCSIFNIPGFFFIHILHMNRQRLKDIQWLFQGHTITKSRDSNSKFYSLQSLWPLSYSDDHLLHPVRSLTSLKS